MEDTETSNDLHRMWKASNSLTVSTFWNININPCKVCLWSGLVGSWSTQTRSFQEKLITGITSLTWGLLLIVVRNQTAAWWAENEMLSEPCTPPSSEREMYRSKSFSWIHPKAILFRGLGIWSSPDVCVLPTPALSLKYCDIQDQFSIRWLAH